MFLRSKSRRKNGKWHRYFSGVENRRVGGGKVCQRQVLYLGEINDAQEYAWRRTLAVFDEERQCDCQMTLFPDDRPIPADAVNALSVRLTELRLRRPRHFGDCWLGLELWRELDLDAFWERALGQDRGAVAWEKVLALLTAMQLIYRKEEQAKVAAQMLLPDPQVKRPLWKTSLFFSALVGILVFAN